MTLATRLLVDQPKLTGLCVVSNMYMTEIYSESIHQVLQNRKTRGLVFRSSRSCIKLRRTSKRVSSQAHGKEGSDMNVTSFPKRNEFVTRT